MNQRLLESKDVCPTFLGIIWEVKPIQRVHLSFGASGAAPGSDPARTAVLGDKRASPLSVTLRDSSWSLNPDLAA